MCYYHSYFLWARSLGMVWLGMGLSYNYRQARAGTGQAHLFLSVSQCLSTVSPWSVIWASSQHGGLGAVGLHTWKFKSLVVSISKKSELYHLWGYSFRWQIASLLPHSTGYKWVSGLCSFKERVIRLHLLMDSSKKRIWKGRWDRRYCCSHLWKIGKYNLPHHRRRRYFRQSEMPSPISKMH